MSPDAAGPRDDAESVARTWLGGRVGWGVLASFNDDDVASLAALLHQRDADLRSKLEQMYADHPEARCYDVPTWSKQAEALEYLRAKLEAARTDAREAREHALRSDAIFSEAVKWKDRLAEQVAGFHLLLKDLKKNAASASDSISQEIIENCLADTEATTASLLAREREKERERCIEAIREARIPTPHPFGPAHGAGVQIGLDVAVAAIRARSEP